MSRKKIEPLVSKGKQKRELDEQVANIKHFDELYRKELKKLTNTSDVDAERVAAFFKDETNSLRNEIKSYMSLGYFEDEALERVLPKAYALVRTGSWYLWDKAHFESQLIGGILLNKGYASELATGEGKTLTAALPAYLNALLGRGVHVITPNSYLAKRDAEEMGKLYNLLGLSCELVEERGKLSREMLDERVNELLENSVAKNDMSNEELLKVYKKAQESLREEDLLKRKKAYQADITYGSSSAIAFDYLYDDIATDANKMVQRSPNFAIIDEVDAVLFDDATTPFTLSGKQSDEDLAITDEETKKMEKNIRLANQAILRIINESKKLQSRSESNGLKDSLVYTITAEQRTEIESIEAIIGENAKKANEYDMNMALILGTNSKQYHLTTLGESIIFQYYYAKDINRILKDRRDDIISMTDENGNLLFREGEDYTINDTGRIVMEPRSFAKLVISNSLPELSEKFDEFGTHELIDNFSEIDNAIRAWFVLKKDMDYMLTVPKDAKSDDVRNISLVMNGRTAEGRVYSNGLQQAIEAKESYLNRGHLQIEPTKIKNTIASIPTASFFARYDKFCGMTGTAAVNAFEDLYGLETYEVPRHKSRQVVDHGDHFYSDRASKNAAIFEEVLKSYERDQPVLISTTSIEESEKLYEYLFEQFKNRGYEVDIPVLNANVDKLEEEARIISKAGLPKAITIATEMAGRGTDIKLGGEIPSVDELLEVVTKEKIDATMNSLQKKGLINDKNLADFQKCTILQVNQEHDRLLEIAKKRHQALEKSKERVLAAGGLKVIGSGHFAYSRVDDQVKGRCGRQGDRGETIFFSDSDDLLRIGVSRETIAKLERMAEKNERKEIVEERLGSTPISDAVYDAQTKTENVVKESIHQNQEIEKEVAIYRSNLRKQRENIKRENEYVDVVEYLIDKTTRAIILGSSSITNPIFTDKTCVKRGDFDFDQLISLTDEFLGVKIEREQIDQFKRLGQLRDYIVELGTSNLDRRLREEGYDKLNGQCKEVVDKFMARSWYDFEDTVENIKCQRSLDAMTQINSYEDVMPHIREAYKHSVESESAMIVREIINPDYREKYQDRVRTEVTTRRATIDGYKKVAHDYDEKQREATEQIVLERQTVKNIQPHPKVFTIVSKTVELIKKPISLIISRNDHVKDSEVQSVNFEESTVDDGKKM